MASFSPSEDGYQKLLTSKNGKPFTDPARLKAQLKQAVQHLRSRGLRVAARWAAELLVSIVVDDRCGNYAKNTNEDLDIKVANLAALPCNQWKYPDEEDKYALAKSLFDLGEYMRVADVLSQEKQSIITDGLTVSSKTLFLSGYSLLLAQLQIIESSRAPDVTITKRLETLSEFLSQCHAMKYLDGPAIYLYALIAQHLGKAAHIVKKLLLESAMAYPWNWSAWQDLSKIATGNELYNEIRAESRCPWMVEFFVAHNLLEHQQSQKAILLYQNLSYISPSSPYIRTQLAVAHYNVRNFDDAQQLFEHLTSEHPHRLENLDTFSNVLYVKEEREKLSQLAHAVVRHHKFRPETCCVVGNYYSLRGNHEKAVLYFQRALRAEPTYLSAWTLMGHEFVELKNTAAAVKCYRRAVEINGNDYRAWYGLGQTYEILQMYSYSLHYYMKATILRPYDARMWCAIAGSYERLGRKDEALVAYERAVSTSDPEGYAAIRLARLHRDMGNLEAAANLFEQHIRLSDVEEVDTPTRVEAMMFLARYHKNQQNISEAMLYCSKLMDCGGPEKDEARALMKEMRNLEGSLANA